MLRVAGAAEQWDLVGRPHEAAYSRWRAGELALHEGRDTLARGLLRRAHAQARGHVPLLGVIDRSRAGMPVPASSPLPGRSAPGHRGTVREHG